jgi:hypothetical protein
LPDKPASSSDDKVLLLVCSALACKEASSFNNKSCSLSELASSVISVTTISSSTYHQ